MSLSFKPYLLAIIMQTVDVVIIGGGAAGLMCAIEAGKRHRKVVILDHANKIGKKILMSGGGRCNFTNLHIKPECYLSHNPHFCKSALKRYTQWDFIDLVKSYSIPFHEKTLGQLFCDHKSQAILSMLLEETTKASVKIYTHTPIEWVKKEHDGFSIGNPSLSFRCESIVIATGGLSIPSMGSTPFGYQIAQQFNIPVLPTRAGLVPFTLQPHDKERFSLLSGIAVESLVSIGKVSFKEQLLFTHRGLSGPAILQLSSYWQGEEILIKLLPEVELYPVLKKEKIETPGKQLRNVLCQLFPKRLVEVFVSHEKLNLSLNEFSDKVLEEISAVFQAWKIKPNGTEGYRTAEVTLGGVDTNALSSKTMQANALEGLYFIGEVLDVTGWLGGYNFQWAWSSGWAAGQVV